ncbi:MAG: response regulator [Chitinivibrionales bacterium]|nr:response regulator [Chitinivibrionales bacterium]MBD3357602.1 response regulator [Chitinivibrionales bacterium]
MNADTSVLIVDDEECFRGFVSDALRSEGYHVHTAEGVVDARLLTAESPVDVVVTDIQLRDGTGLELVRHFQTISPATGIIVITGYPDQDHVAFSEEREVCAFLTKPFSAEQIRYSVLAALRRSRDMNPCRNEEKAKMKNNLGLIGVSSYLTKLRQEIRRIVGASFPVLILGPSGTGKELIAKAIHEQSPRRLRPMITINCAAIPRHLEESEFFGYARGAFTGAATHKHGIIASADGSTLFLDEVGELSPETQAKLLRVLDSGEYMRVGDTQSHRVDLRIVSATNCDLEQMVKEGSFRRDLYYRLKGCVIQTKQLDEHTEDIPLLVEAFLTTVSHPECPRRITAGAMQYLVKKHWPGNIRELKHTVCLLANAARGMKRINLSAVETALHSSDARCDPPLLTYQEAKERALREFEIPYFKELILRYSGNLNRAAQAAGMHRPNLVRKLRGLGISPEPYRALRKAGIQV